MVERPKIEEAPGLCWRKQKSGRWEARWRARKDLVRRGYTPKMQRLWVGLEADEMDRKFIAGQCGVLQGEMLIWSRGGIPLAPEFDGTIASLSHAYQSDADSDFRKLRYRSREHYVCLCRRLEADHGGERLENLKARDFLRWYEKWTEKGHIAMAHALMGMLRTLVGFGKLYLEDEQCERLAGVLHGMRFTAPRPREERLTADQVIAIRQEAHRAGLHSIALAQAFQFDCTFRQKDVIGEYVPLSEPGMSDVTVGNMKWLRGIRWEEIDANWILRHTTSKRQKDIEIDLKLAPMVMEEIALSGGRKASGPIIVSDIKRVPWMFNEFRRQWRLIARKVGVPDHVKNMDSRAGAISEATDAGASLESVRHAATHSDIAMTQRYSRGSTDKIADVMKARAAHRNKAGK